MWRRSRACITAAEGVDEGVHCLGAESFAAATERDLGVTAAALSGYPNRKWSLVGRPRASALPLAGTSDFDFEPPHGFIADVTAAIFRNGHNEISH